MLHAEKKGDRIYARGGNEYGLTTGGIRICQLEGCGGYRIAVRWPDGKLTYPCDAAMFVRPADRYRQIA